MMLVWGSHSNHEPSWTFELDGGGHQCLLCLVDILSEVKVISGVQRCAALTTLRTLLQGRECILSCTRGHAELLYHILDLTTEFYCSQNFLETAVSVVSTLITRTQDETILKYFLDKFFEAVHCKRQKDPIHFSLLVMVQVCDFDSNNTRMLMAYKAQVLSSLLEPCMHASLGEGSRRLLTQVLRRVLREVTKEGGGQWGSDVEDVVWKTVEGSVAWLNDGGMGREGHRATLELLKELMQSPELLQVLLDMGRNEGHVVGQIAPSLLMGLKKVLSTKDESAVELTMQCLHHIVTEVGDTQRCRDLMSTDLAEFVFESLHTKNPAILSSVFQCLVAMAQHQVFFDKCHAVYGIDSCLAAVRESLDSANLGTAEIGLELLRLLLERQPENMPLFVSQSWSQCCHIIERVLGLGHASMSQLAVCCAASFFWPQHQVAPVNIEKLGSLIKAVAQVSECLRLSQISQDSMFIMQKVADISVTISIIITDNKTLCGNDIDKINDFKSLHQYLVYNLIIPFVKDNPCSLDDEDMLTSVLSVIEGQVEHEECKDIVAASVPWLILSSLTSSTNESLAFQAGQILAKLLLRVGGSVAVMSSPECWDEPRLASGLASLSWSQGQPEALEWSLCGQQEVLAVLAMIHVSQVMGVHMLGTNVLVGVLHKIAVICPELVSDEHTDATRSYVYIYCCARAALSDLGAYEINDLDEWLLGQLHECPVQKWFFKHDKLFQWIFSSDEKSDYLGGKVVDHWTTELGSSFDEGGCIDYIFGADDIEILRDLANNFNFLKSLLSLWSKSVANSQIALKMLMWWISGVDNDPDMFSDLFEQVFRFTCQHFEEAVASSLQHDEQIKSFILPVMCGLFSSPLSKEHLWSFRPKSVIYVAKLFTFSTHGTLALEFLSHVCKVISKPDSKALIIPIMQLPNFPENMQKAFKAKDNVFSLALIIMAWLAENGGDYNEKCIITIPVEDLMPKLARITSYGCPLLSLLEFALSGMKPANVPSHLPSYASARVIRGPVRFVKKSHSFLVRDEVFTVTELRQIYVYLQQCLLHSDYTVRMQCVRCVEALTYMSQEVCQYITQQPWNHILMESILVVRLNDGITEAELCFLEMFITNGMNIWTSGIAASFLKSVLTTEIGRHNEEKVVWLYQQLKSSNANVDKELLSSVESHLKTSNICFGFV